MDCCCLKDEGGLRALTALKQLGDGAGVVVQVRSAAPTPQCPQQISSDEGPCLPQTSAWSPPPAPQSAGEVVLTATAPEPCCREARTSLDIPTAELH